MKELVDDAGGALTSTLRTEKTIKDEQNAATKGVDSLLSDQVKKDGSAC